LAGKNRSTFNPYAGVSLVRFYGFDLSPELNRVYPRHPKKTVRM